MWKTWSITKNKSLEIVLDKPNECNSYFDIKISWTKKTDHAGFRLWIELFNLVDFQVALTDNRHWNDKENRWFRENEYSEDDE